MELSVREAALFLERSPRTVRAQLARGELPGVKRGGRWRIDRRHLPLTEAQRRGLQQKADSLRQTMEAALPSRLATTAGQRSRSIADLAAFRAGAKLLAELRQAGTEALAPELRKRLQVMVEEALLALAEAGLHYDRDQKLAAVHRCRAGLARAAALLLLATDLEPEPPVLGWVTTIETEIVPAVAGFARWAERLGGRRR
jgi:excisionase family DNA binding protein